MRWILRNPGSRLGPVLPAAAVVVALHLAPCAAQVEPPVNWELRQNDPDPFCRDPDGATRIVFAAPQAAQVELVVFDPDSTAVVRRLIQGALPAGMFAVQWDGLDETATALPDGRYPYTLVATDMATSEVLFAGSKAATIRCVTATEAHRWGSVKARFR
jgi:hypothetical protein